MSMRNLGLLCALAVLGHALISPGESLVAAGKASNSSISKEQSEVARNIITQFQKVLKDGLGMVMKKPGPGGNPKQLAKNKESSHLSLFTFDEVPGYKASIFLNLVINPKTRVKRCPAGSSMEQGSTSCTKCTAATFSAAGKACKPCPAGTSSEPGSSSCTKCTAGTFSAAGKACKPCPAGTSSEPGSSSCTKCTAATFSAAGKACKPCPAGTSSEPGSSSCTKCTAGTFSAAGKACKSCPAGTSSEPGSSSCTKCTAGTFSAAGKTCKPCPAGSYSPAGSTRCIPCPKGHYTNTTGSSQCRPCDPGSYSSSIGATKCQMCDLNFAMSHRSGMDRCDLCPNQGATRNNSSCFRKAKMTCYPPKFFKEFGGGNGSLMCKKTIDNDIRTFGTSFVPIKNTWSHPRSEHYATYFVYFLRPAANVRRIAIWHRTGCCVEELKHLTLRFFEVSEQYWSGGQTCLVNGIQEAARSTGAYRFISHCQFNNVESLYVEPSKDKHAFFISEIVVYSE